MAYATLDDLKSIYPENIWVMLGFENNDGTIDEEPLEQSLNNASSEMDLYLGARYVLPLLEPIPVVLKEFNCAICIYKRSQELDTLTDERRQRYEDIIKQLRDIAKGIIDVPLIVDSSTTQSSSIVTSKNPAILTNQEEPRLFTRNKMRGL